MSHILIQNGPRLCPKVPKIVYEQLISFELVKNTGKLQKQLLFATPKGGKKNNYPTEISVFSHILK